jgi:Protein of Unknown function (DUF2784)
MAAYHGDFIAHYLLPVLYPAGLTPRIQIFLGFLVIAVNAGIYACLLIRARRKSAHPRVS